MATSAKTLLLKKDQAKLKTLRERLPAVIAKYGVRDTRVLKAKHDIEKLQDKIYMRSQDIRFNIKGLSFGEAIERLLLQCNEHQEQFIKLNNESSDLMARFKLDTIKQFISDDTWAALDEAAGFVKDMVDDLNKKSAEENQKFLDRINGFEEDADYFALIGFQFELATAYNELQAEWQENVFRSTELFAEKVEMLTAEIDRGNANV